MSVTNIDLCSEKLIIEESETEISKKNQEDQKPISGNNIVLYEELILNDISNKNLNDNMILQVNEDVLETEDTKDLKSFDMPSDFVASIEYDAFESDNKIYRKYKLRQRKNTEISQEDKDDIVPALQKSSRRITKSRGDFTCPYCFMFFVTRSYYIMHVASHEKKPPFVCSQCSVTFMSNAELVSHKDTHINDENVHFCKLCKLAFSEYCDFLIHKTTHRLKKQYKCPECDYVCFKKYYMQKHIETHFLKKVKCHVCSKMIIPTNIQRHLKEHTNKYQCGECGKECKTNKSFQYHMSSHTGVKPFQCFYCGKGFSSGSQRSVHTRIHTGEKNYECSVCFEKFRQITDRNRHLITHDSVKKYKCTVCDKKFFHKSYLDKVHMKMHMKKFEYQCTLCEKAYHDKNGLKAHVMYVHTNERPYRCKRCNVEFVDKCSYDRHCSSKRHKNQQ